MVLINNLIGNFGKYHLWLTFIILVNKFGVGLHQMAIIFLAPPTQFTCQDKSECCDNPIYNTTLFKRTIITEWNLICKDSWLKDFTQTVFQFGVLIGSLIFGAASDRYGRRKTLIFAVVMESLTGIIASFLPDFWSFTIIRMFLGISVGGIMVIGFVLLMEYVGIMYRDALSALFHVPFTMGHIALALFGYYIRDYTHLQLAISVVNMVLLFYICFLPESPRWLLAINKSSKAIALMERVAKFNNLPTDEIPTMTELYQMEHKSARMKRGSILDLFRTPNMRRNILIMAFLWLVCSYCFYGVAHYISHLTGDIYTNVIASGSVALCSCFISIPLIRFLRRKTLVIASELASSICLILIAFVPEGTISIVLGCTGVFFTFMVFIVVYLYCSEMFPTVVRNAAIGICSMMARVGSMIAPFIAGLRPFGIWCAPVAFGIFPLISAVLCLFLPETKNCELPMTIEEGEALGRNQNQNVTVAEDLT
ncbi:organic cation transporter protein-like [Papilio machaon]|uniref:organic cation transporter protein-like n=1 Tax=Papilio machaon TaxID=76193 RepID=UPI001E663DDB|nr:organic cation transporter protein-like [Papilio machaon]